MPKKHNQPKQPKLEKKKRGFAVMDPKLVRKIASMGGKTVSRNSRHMAKIGSIGGANSHKLTNGRKARAEA